MGRVIITLVIMLSFLHCNEPQRQSDIKNLNWGMTKDEVIDNESCEVKKSSIPMYQGYFSEELKSSQIDFLVCYGEYVGDYKCSIKFYLTADELFEISYFFNNINQLANKDLTLVEIEEVEKYLDKLLTKQFGNSTDYEEYNFKNNDITYEKTWEDEKTLAVLKILKMYSVNGKSISINFVSKNFKVLFEKHNKKSF